MDKNKKIETTLVLTFLLSDSFKSLSCMDMHQQFQRLCLHILIKMWKCIVKCHQKQFQAISGITSCVHVKAGVQKDSSSNATQKLEHEILNSGVCFSDYVTTQKAFVRFLNEWLLQSCLFQEPEEMPDGIAPFSPNKIGAPPIFVVCNDWYHVIENIAENGVSKAIDDFATRLRQLLEKQAEEHNERLKAEYLSKAFKKHQSYLLQASEKMNQNQNGTAFEYLTENEVLLLGEVNADLALLWKKLDIQIARHEEAIIQANHAASGCLRGGLVPIFESLKRFSSGNLEAYDQVGIPNAV